MLNSNNTSTHFECEIDNLDYENCDEIFQGRPQSLNRQRIYEEMRQSLGLIDVDIEFSIGAPFPYTLLYKEENGSIRKCIEVHMTNDSQEHCYRASLRHELEHVITGNQLMELIGLEDFVALQREKEKEASLAFKTISEYLSWKAACEENEFEKRYQGIYSSWKESRCSFVDFCDVLASHIAYKTVHGVSSDEAKEFSKENQDLLLDISILIKDGADKWPMTLTEFAQIGEQMNKLLLKITD